MQVRGAAVADRVARRDPANEREPNPCCRVIRLACCRSIERLASKVGNVRNHSRRPFAAMHLPARLGRAETGAKMTATWQLRTLPPTYIVCPLIETS